MGDIPADATTRELVLASSSPRRRELLRKAGYRFSVRAPEIEEHTHPAESPEDAARRLALEKGRAVADALGPGACILAADTMVVLGEEILGKPRDAEDAQRMLLRLARRTHRVVTGFALIRSDDGVCEQGVAVSRVRMGPVTPAEARAYAETGEPLDKAGGYAVQGGAARFVVEIDGSRDNVIGLPLEQIAPLLERMGVRPS